MKNVVRLDDYRKRRKPARREPAAAGAGPHYYCTRCDSDEFRLHAIGVVHCARCGARMGNLSVADPAAGRQGSKP